jgi:aerobic-type carbon monoxide dehydrogenase small subunit (CoxS/CutS family)
LSVVLNVNGRKRRVDAAAGETLLTLLRDRLDLTGTKYGCGEGQCGACSVLVDGKVTRSCQTSAADVAGRRITTIEGLGREGRLHPLQETFLAVEAFQCGFCTPGMIVCAAALLAANPSPTPAEIVEHMAGNVCRCGTYPRIVEAVTRAAKPKKS